MTTADTILPNNHPDALEKAQGARNLYGVAGLAPIFLLAPPRSFTSIVCAMLGQHPQLYGFPETQLFTTETLAEKLKSNPGATHRIRNGLLRLVAQLFLGDQTEGSIEGARSWLLRRGQFSTGYVFEILADRVYPLIPVEKSPDVVYEIASLRRALRFFPHARFIHLFRHPRGYCDSNLRYYRGLQERGQSLPQWMFCSVRGSELSAPPDVNPIETRILDPQRGWYLHNMRIRKFLACLPSTQQTWVRGEDLIRDPDGGLRRIADWLHLRSDPDAVEQMKHPERSAYAFIGPPNARYGNSRSFLENPTLQPSLAKPYNLDGPLPWRTDGRGFSPEVKELAVNVGYN